jgi:D-amino-acid dehydrogenase
MAKVIVMGAGIVGLTTAYQLVKAGHTVCVIERHDGVAQETSFANAGQLSYAFISPLAAPGVLQRVPGWLLERHGPLRLGRIFNTEFAAWMVRFMRACNAREYAYTTGHLLELAMYSRDMWDRFIEDEAPEFAHSQHGKLIVHRRAQALQAADRWSEQVQRYGYAQRRVNAQECVEIEPALAYIAPQLAGGIFTPGEQAGDCQQVSEVLRARIAQASPQSEFLFNTPVLQLVAQGKRLSGVQTPAGLLQADAYVVANGMGARALTAPLQIDLPIYPLKGYSLSYPIAPAEAGVEAYLPRVSITDYDRKVAYARLGSQLRVAGMADLVGYSTVPEPGRVDSLKSLATQAFPALSRFAPRPWAGLRPATPSGRPLVGGTRFANLWVNAGHGGLGFTLAMGSACALVAQIEQRTGALDMTAFAVG